MILQYGLINSMNASVRNNPHELVNMTGYRLISYPVLITLILFPDKGKCQIF